jgi:hypothetical protein
MARHELYALGNQKAEIQRWVVHNSDDVLKPPEIYRYAPLGDEAMSQFLNSFERDVARGASSRLFASVRERDHSTEPGATSSGATQAWWAWVGPAIPADRKYGIDKGTFPWYKRDNGGGVKELILLALRTLPDNPFLGCREGFA